MPRARTQTVYDTLSSASAGLGIPQQALTFLRAKGAPGFRNGKVYEETLKSWITQHPEVYTLSLAVEEPKRELNPLQKKQMELLDVKIKRETGDLISKEALATASQKCFGPIVEIARRHLAPDTYNTFCKEVREAFERLALEAIQSPDVGN